MGSRTVLQIISPRRAAIVGCVALVSALLVLLIQRWLGSGDWEVADALAGIVNLIATTIVIVGLLEWSRRRRWQRAENEDLRSLILQSGLVVSGWSSPKNLGPPDLDPAKVLASLDEQIEALAASAQELDDLYKRLIGERDMVALLELAKQRWTLEGYYLEGSRTRRINYLSDLVDVNLPGLVERRDDPGLFALFVALRDSVARAEAAADHARVIVREHVLVDQPAILKPYLEVHPESSAVDPVFLLARVIACATDELMEQDTVAEMLNSTELTDAALEKVTFANRCVGAVRNEIEWVYSALSMLGDILRALEGDIRTAAAEVEGVPQPAVAALS